MRIRPGDPLVVVVQMTVDEAREVADLIEEWFPLNAADLLDAADTIEQYAGGTR